MDRRRLLTGAAAPVALGAATGVARLARLAGLARRGGPSLGSVGSVGSGSLGSLAALGACTPPVASNARTAGAAAPATETDAAPGGERRIRARPGGPLEPVLGLAAAREVMLALINRDRREHGLAPVVLDEIATRADQPHTDAMVIHGFHGHYGLAGDKPDQRYTAAGGMDVAFENAYSGAAWYGRRIDGVLPLAALQVTRSELEAIQSGFYNEVPPNDGHRRNILAPRHNRVGIALSQAGSRDTTLRLACTQLFVDHYGLYGALPRTVRRGDAFTVEGRFFPGLALQAVLLRHEPLPVPQTVEALNRTGSYGAPNVEPVLALFPDDPRSPVTVSGGGGGQRFRADVRTRAQWPVGLYYVQIWATPAGSREPVIVSQRTVAMP